jgi:hypothetical protein
MAKIVAVLFLLVLAGCTGAPVRYIAVEVVGKQCDASGYNCYPVYRPVASTAVVEGAKNASAETAQSVPLPAHTEVWMGQGYWYYQPQIVAPCCLPRKGDKWYRW